MPDGIRVSLWKWAGAIVRGAMPTSEKRDMGHSAPGMERRNAYEEDRRTGDRFASTIVIAASIIAAVRLVRDENISRPSRRLTPWSGNVSARPG